MMKKAMPKINSRLLAADAAASTFLLVPHESSADRQAARDGAAALMVDAVTLLVRGGCDELAQQAQALVGKIDAVRA